MINQDTIIEPLSIDCVIFGFEDGQMKVLLIKRNIHPSKGMWALPGGFIKNNEDIDTSAVRILNELTSVSGLYLEQLKAFGTVNRYPDKRVITIGYYAFIKPGNYSIQPGTEATEVAWNNIYELPPLPFDHQEIVDFALKNLRRKLKREPIGFNLLPEKFTLNDLLQLYEAIYNTTFDKPNFRRKILNMNLLLPLQEKQKGGAHRSPRLYKFDAARYAELKQNGFTFEM